MQNKTIEDLIEEFVTISDKEISNFTVPYAFEKYDESSTKERHDFVKSLNIKNGDCVFVDFADNDRLKATVGNITRYEALYVYHTCNTLVWAAKEKDYTDYYHYNRLSTSEYVELLIIVPFHKIVTTVGDIYDMTNNFADAQIAVENLVDI